jgi:NADH-quinone oxidoreductase subunit L
MDAHAVHSAANAAVAVGGSGTKLQDIAWAALFFPLVCAFGTLVFTRKDRALTAGFNIAGVVLSFLLSFILFAAFGGQRIDCTPVHWLPLEGLDATMGLHLDGLSALMLLVVTGVASVVMIFSTGYMKDDPGYSRFFMTLSLFVFSMLGIVLADNLVMLFVFWELVGFSSYLLIGFWHEKPAAGDACKKAFLTNRLGDFGFLLGILMVWAACGTVNIGGIEAAIAKNPNVFGVMASLAGILIFLGAMGKSAQFPLHVWLPDAMEGPTPVSALIHAATMVAAGVYMLCRVFVIYTVPAGWPPYFSLLSGISAATLISLIGCFTALLAALIAVQQNDIKRILAYSTLSQLGYMVMAVGLGAGLSTPNPSAAMYHLVTHAAFKAMLFLGAGAVIHACHHEQDIWKMGGLREKMPWTFATFGIGTLALVGCPLFSGFYSKDAILATALESNPVLFVVAVAVAVLTTFYMGRLVIVTFFGPARTENADHAHEVSGSMKWPLVTLAVPSVMIAWLPLGDFLARHFDPHFHSHGGDVLFGPFNHNAFAAFFGVFAFMLGSSAAVATYWGKAKDPLPALLGRFARGMRKRFYFDELYEALVIPLHDAAAAVADWVDRWLIGGLGVRGISGATDFAGRALRLVQTGSIQTYTFLFAAGVVVIALITLK